jgi:hypothetical protein
MARTDAERYDQALKYIETEIDRSLAAKLAQKAGVRKADLGKAISLTKGGFWNTGTKTQHMALRGLLLCQQVFLKPPESTADYAKDGSEAKNFFKTKTEDQVKEAIRSYTCKTSVTLDDFANTALKITSPIGTFDAFSRTRSDTSFGGVTNCYGAVKIWLFNSGCCSLPWCLKEGATIDAYSVNRIIGNGAVVAEADIEDIPKGYVFNIQDSVDPYICHWGVSLGDGWAAASNTTPGEVGPHGAVMVNFRKGNTSYGEFTLESAVAVCKLKYNSHQVTIKALDPTRNSSYY